MSNLSLKILAHHPVQYHVPFYRALAQYPGIELMVCYISQGSAAQKSFDAGFNINIEWDIDLLAGYVYQILSKTYLQSFVEQVLTIPKLLSWAFDGSRSQVLLMGWFNWTIWMLWFILIVSGRKVLVLAETTPQSYGATKKPAWRNCLLRWLLQHTAGVLYIGSRNRQFYIENGVKTNRLFPVPYSVENNRFSQEATRLRSNKIAICHKLSLNPALPTFLFCGKLIHKKRPIELLNAFVQSGLANKAQLVFVGEGPLHEELQSLIYRMQLNNVHLIGFLNQSDMPLSYVVGDLLCLISDATETWGLVVNEALACGLPVIVAETCGCSPDLVTSANGWTVQLDNPNMLCQALTSAFDMRQNWDNMGAIGQAIIETHTVAKMAEGVFQALSSA